MNDARTPHRTPGREKLEQCQLALDVIHRVAVRAINNAKFDQRGLAQWADALEEIRTLSDRG